MGGQGSESGYTRRQLPTAVIPSVAEGQWRGAKVMGQASPRVQAGLRRLDSCRLGISHPPARRWHERPKQPFRRPRWPVQKRIGLYLGDFGGKHAGQCREEASTVQRRRQNAPCRCLVVDEAKNSAHGDALVDPGGRADCIPRVGAMEGVGQTRCIR